MSTDKKEIDDGICFDISMVSEELAPERTMPDEVASIVGYIEFCLMCKITDMLKK